MDWGRRKGAARLWRSCQRGGGIFQGKEGQGTYIILLYSSVFIHPAYAYVLLMSTVYYHCNSLSEFDLL